jgi:shikimate kinase
MLKKGGHIILIGMSGAGKTTIGKQLSMRLHRSFIDTDHHIEAQYNKSISDIFKSEGEAEFRRYESLITGELESRDPSVISVGGGLPCHHQNMTRLLRMGTVIYLQVSVKELCHRLTLDQINRPLYNDISENQMENHTRTLLKKRQSTYLKSDIVIDSDSSLEVVLDEILRVLV